MHKIRYLYKGRLAFSSHDQISDLIIKNKAKKVLDIGCYKGFIGRSLKEKKWKNYIVGLDKDPACKTVLKNHLYNKFLHLDVEEGFSEIKEKYDAIVFADVLEHLNNPTLALIKAKKILSKNGEIYISLPNIANFFIRIQLLFGNFTYHDYGILDKDHRYFFTFKSSQNLINQAGLRITKVSSTPVPTPFLTRNKTFKMPLLLLYYLARLLVLIRKEVFAYQFIFVCNTK